MNEELKFLRKSKKKSGGGGWVGGVLARVDLNGEVKFL